MRLIWVQGWPSRIPKFHHKDLDFETKNGSWPKKMTLRKKQTKHHFTSFHSNSRNFMDLIHLRFSTLVVNPRPSERPALPQSSCWKNHTPRRLGTQRYPVQVTTALWQPTFLRGVKTFVGGWATEKAKFLDESSLGCKRRKMRRLLKMRLEHPEKNRLSKEV